MSEFSCNVSKEEYCSIVEQTKEFIRDGDIFQAVISRQFTAEYDGSLMNAYRVLRTSNPSPYMVFMKIDGLELMCASPKLWFACKTGGLRPFLLQAPVREEKASRRTKKLWKQSSNGEKELSEHNMLVVGA